jgi:type I restriction enzyme M protein
MTPINTPHMTATLRQQTGEAAKLDAAIAANLKELGYGG